MRAPAAIVTALTLAAPLAVPGAAAAPQQARPSTVDFAREVRPILSDNCFQCHGPDPATREANLRFDVREAAIAPHGNTGAAIVAGDAGASELIYRIAPEFESDLMPPESSGKSLTSDEVATLRRWIDEGALYDEHWSFVAPRRIDAEGAHSIDRFVDGRLGREGLALRDEAAPAALLRRVALDLTGLPPTPERRRTFEQQVESEGIDAAYAAIVDELLASPRYGVHMARPWLDAARYADTHGLHLDNRRSMWPYRDWVVAALNQNMPFDQFTIEQLAGDLLPEATLDQQIASGFNRCNPSSAEGGMIAEEYLSIYAKDRADTTATVWLGLTLGCAQCHDHKFDPIRQLDYYGMYAFFNSLTEEASDRNIENPQPFVRTPQAEDAETLAALDGRLDELAAVLAAPNPELDAAEARWRDAETARLRTAWRALVPEAAAATGGSQLTIDSATGVVSASGANPKVTTYTIDAWVPPGAIDGIRLDALVPEGEALPGRASNRNFVLTNVEVLAAPSVNDGAWTPIELREAVATFSQSNWPIDGVLDPSPTNGWAGLGRNGARSAMLVPARAFGFEAGTELRVRLHFQSVHEQHSLARLRLAVKRTGDRSVEVRQGAWFRSSFTADSANGLFERDFIDEASIRAGLDVREASWDPEPGFVDGTVHPLAAGLGTHYLVRRLWANGPRHLELRLGSDDGIEVWLRGEKILSRNVARAAALDQELVPVQLIAGVNELVLKVVNTGGASAFAYRAFDGRSPTELPASIELALLDGGLDSDALKGELQLHYRSQHEPEWARTYESRRALVRDRDGLLAALPTTLISEERSDRRPAHVLMRGAYDKKGEVVEPMTPAVLPPMPADLPRNRLGLARWIASKENPLTARVWVNRAWQHFFGRGIVSTPEDFGAQGAWPTHPELLDWLALTFVDEGWDMKSMHRRIVLSRAYRQDSSMTSALLELDPENALVSRGPRHRLDGEVLRDQALFIAGLLDETMGGPGVRPYQPDGVWFAVGYSRSNTVRYEQGPLDHLHRRSLYTFWKRTAPPPNLTTFDAPMRDACTVVRERTNTPLQALITLNDPTYVEAARFTAQRLLLEAGTDTRLRATRLFERVVGRTPAGDEVNSLVALADELLAEYAEDVGDAAMLIGVGDLPASEDLDITELAAWTLVASTLLNLDEVLTKS